MMTRKWILLVALCVTQASFAANYKWTDESGRVHYGSQPPAGVKAEQIRSVGPSSTQAQEIERFKNKQAEQVKQLKLSEERQAELDKIKEQKQVWKANCNTAKRNLVSLENKPKVRKRDAYGNLVVIPEADLKKSIKDAKEAVDLYCNPPKFE